MSVLEITGGALAAVVLAGAYMKWAAGPVVVAYRLGRGAERVALPRAGKLVAAFRLGYKFGRADRAK